MCKLFRLLFNDLLFTDNLGKLGLILIVVLNSIVDLHVQVRFGYHLGLRCGKGVLSLGEEIVCLNLLDIEGLNVVNDVASSYLVFKFVILILVG